MKIGNKKRGVDFAEFSASSRPEEKELQRFTDVEQRNLG